MKLFLAPAVAFLNRLGFRGKFALISVCVVCALAGLGGFLGFNLWGEVEATRNEQVGVRALTPALHALKEVQRHRGLMTSVLSGQETARGRVEETAAQATRWMDEVDAVLKAAPLLAPTARKWQDVREEWARLVATGGSMDATANRLAHRALIEHLLDYGDDVITASGLLLDREADGFYLVDATLARLPDVIERIGKMRAMGNQLLTQKAATDRDREDLAALLAVSEARYQSVVKELKKASVARPGLAAAVERLEGETGPQLKALTVVVRQDILGGRYETPPADWFSRTTATIDGLYEHTFKALIPTLEDLLAARHARLLQNFAITVAVAVGVSLLIIYLLAAVSSAIGGAVESLAASAERVADGDLTVKVELPCRDELQRVAGAFNRMSESIALLLRGARQTADDLSLAADSLVAASGEVAASSSGQSDAASAMAAAVEQMTVGINHISSNAQDAQGEASQAGQLAQEGGEVVSRTIDDINRISEVVQRTAGIVGSLGERSTQISAIVGTIKEIADQTNLLALNAAIEAARAGEQGRGFAVVADEVRKLAERTGQSTQEIAAMVKAIQDSTQDAVRAMEEGVGRVDEGVGRAGQAGSAIAEIRDGAGRTVQAINEISDALREQSAASTEIARRVEGIAQMAERNSVNSGETAQTAHQLKALAGHLEQDIARFRLP
ncbi:methyl-accepting chemotaxis protein [Zoogloea sp.]|uniref:methyl-accepting chemotaxis protein n=1 Tax=Zoogloea sp. TaxID=49181 RepID=UPI0035B46B2B